VSRFFHERGFVLFDAPILTPTSCEGTTNLFELGLLRRAQGVPDAERTALCGGGALAFGKVYCFGRPSGGKNPKRGRHLTEFWMVEPEMAYCDSRGDMELAEHFVSYIVGRVLERRTAELKTLERDTTKLEASAKTP